jgi:diguanylate cyclase (GGDEF)-like protein
LAGDELLRQVAHRILAGVRLSDRVAGPDARDEVTVSRLGGDEFMVMLTKLANPGNAAIVARRLTEELARPFELEAAEVNIGASIGIAIFPQDGATPDELITNGDRALASAKQSGRGKFEFFGSEMSERARRRDNIEMCLKNSIRQGELSLHYQPICETKTLELVGIEVLLRWNSTQLGSVGPDEFIPIAEESGMILDIGRWVFDSVCEQLTAWRTLGYHLPHLAVNISARQLLDPDFVSDVDALLRRWDVVGSAFEFELTESSIISENPDIDHALNQLTDMGVTLALDDFGTGFSSLSHLRRFRFAHLKIDKSFVLDIGREPADEELVRAIISLAKDLRIETVAEGVETDVQLEFLREQGCDRVQGYFLGRPVDADTFTQQLADRVNS